MNEKPKSTENVAASNYEGEKQQTEEISIENLNEKTLEKISEIEKIEESKKSDAEKAEKIKEIVESIYEGDKGKESTEEPIKEEAKNIIQPKDRVYLKSTDSLLKQTADKVAAGAKATLKVAGSAGKGIYKFLKGVVNWTSMSVLAILTLPVSVARWVKFYKPDNKKKK